MTEYRHMAMDVGYRFYAQIKLMCRLQRELHWVRESEQIYAYCLDAPELLPAGGCENFAIPEIAENFVTAAQLTIKREGA